MAAARADPTSISRWAAPRSLGPTQTRAEAPRLVGGLPAQNAFLGHPHVSAYCASDYMASLASAAVPTLILLRHGQSEWNEKDLFTGWIDVDLTATGRGGGPRPAAGPWPPPASSPPSCTPRC